VDTGREEAYAKAAICTYTGVQFFPLAPRYADINILDIAHALSMKCRYTGHCSEFYSVATHSLFVSHILELWGASPVKQLCGLLHDASEAYLPDVATPVKDCLGGFREIEDRVQEQVALAFDLPGSFHPVVKEADLEAYRFESLRLLPRVDWRPLPLVIATFYWSFNPLVNLTIEQTKEKFIRRFNRLRENLKGDGA
jgi:hypothetical protein